MSTASVAGPAGSAPSSRLAGLVALITGAARGQGEAEARLFAAEGASVVVADVLDAGRNVANQLGEQALFVDLDVSDERQWAAAVEQALSRFGRLDVLVNNAAIDHLVAFEDETAEAFRATLEVNLVGVFLGMQAVLAPMQAVGGGSIVNVSSVSGVQGQAWHAAYTASKWGVRGLTKSAAVELGPAGIRVNAILPGAIDTPMLPPDRSGLTNEQRFAGLPLGRVGLPEEIARTALFLASTESSYLTGADIVVDGGMSVGPPRTPRPAS